MTFEQWWVEEFGHPPLPEEIEMFQACRKAWDESRREAAPLSIEKKREQLTEMLEDCILFDGYEDALIGVCHRFGREPIAIYDMDQCFDTLMAEGIDYDAASDHFFTNTMGTWAGDKTPAFLKRFE